MNKAFDIGVLKFKPDVSLEQQRVSVDRLGDAMRRLPGFLNREVYYDATGGRWIDVIGWETLEQAQASGDIVKDPAIAEIFASFDEGAVILGIYERIA